ncbi:hypothetical protein EHM76_01800 [bacterium]|nr:MAG: hypothetical protein EHM76_01800 [bacterium]
MDPATPGVQDKGLREEFGFSSFTIACPKVDPLMKKILKEIKNCPESPRLELPFYPKLSFSRYSVGGTDLESV